MKNLTISLLCLLSFTIGACCNFNEKIAIEELTSLKPEAKIKSINWEVCSGTYCDCVYVNLIYKNPNSEITMDTTLQYWRIGDGWLTRTEYLEQK